MQHGELSGIAIRQAAVISFPCCSQKVQKTASFYPDFIVWKKGNIFCLDTKGSHLLSDAVARKLFDIKEDGKTKLQVRLITEGKQTVLRGKVIKGGYTVWKMKLGAPTPIHWTI